MIQCGHGTFLASLAASSENSEYRGSAPEAEIIVVKLKQIHKFFYDYFVFPESQENAYSSADLLLAIEYMISKSGELGMPISICIGLGTNMTGHDGYSVLEEYLSRVSLITGVCICVAAGNESNAKHHASGVLEGTNSTYDVQIRVPENADSFPIGVVVGPSDRMSVSITSPTGEVIPRAPARSVAITQTRLILERTTVIVQYFFPIARSGIQYIAIKLLTPTPGIWTITLYGDIILNGRFDVWLHMTGFLTP
ncbi:MAG: peptidase, partial [Firmicutes bacterium]|nr:peptidase [Bacillota bacterium]